jgi:hypothetical protein
MEIVWFTLASAFIEYFDIDKQFQSIFCSSHFKVSKMF